MEKGIFLIKRRSENKEKKEESKSKTDTEEEDRSDPVIEANISTRDDKLEVTIISNKTPVLEKIEPQSETEVKTLKSSRLRKMFSCFLGENKSSVNLPRSEWLGPTACTVKKTVKLSSLRKVLKQAGRSDQTGQNYSRERLSKFAERRTALSRHEDVQLSWDNSVNHHRLRRNSAEARVDLLERWKEKLRYRSGLSSVWDGLRSLFISELINLFSENPVNSKFTARRD